MIEPARLQHLPESAAAALPADLPGRLVVYDGVCALCSGSMRWIAARSADFHFVSAQSPLGTALLQHHDLPVDVYTSNLVLVDGVAHTRFDGMLAVTAALGWPWKAALVFRLLPAGVRDWIYERIAQNRFTLFGAADHCEPPSAELRRRFLG